MNKLGTRRGPYRNRREAGGDVDEMAVQGIPCREIWQALVGKYPGLDLKYVRNRSSWTRFHARRRGEMEPVPRRDGVKAVIYTHRNSGFQSGHVTSSLNNAPEDLVQWIYGQTNRGRLTVADALVEIARREYERQAGTPTGTM